MQQTPHKNTSRKFLKDLIDSDFITEGGREFVPCEVRDLFNEKSTRLAQQEFDQMHKAEGQKPQLGSLPPIYKSKTKPRTLWTSFETWPELPNNDTKEVSREVFWEKVKESVASLKKIRKTK